MHYTNCLKDSHTQWEDLLVKKGEETEPDTPCITRRTLPIPKCTESFEEFLHQVISVQQVPLVYVIQNEATVGPPPPLMNNDDILKNTDLFKEN